MNIAIIGPGAIGLLLAGYLHKSRAAVTLVDQFPERAERLNRSGVRWEGVDQDFHYNVPVTVGLRDPGGTDLAILCVKAYHTDAATRELCEAGYTGPVMTLQNGVGNVEAIGRNLSGSPLIAGVTSEGANLIDDCHVRHAGKGKTSFGPIEPGRPGREFLSELISIMRSAGLDAELSDDPQSLIWSKLLVNVGINALTAICKVRNGQLLQMEPARSMMADLVSEGWEVVLKKKIRPVYGDPVARVEEVCALTAANFSSMYMDLKEGRQTEIDFINGAIVREGAALGLPCPRNDMVTKIIRSLESLRTAEER